MGVLRGEGEIGLAGFVGELAGHADRSPETGGGERNRPEMYGEIGDILRVNYRPTEIDCVNKKTRPVSIEIVWLLG